MIAELSDADIVIAATKVILVPCAKRIHYKCSPITHPHYASTIISADIRVKVMLPAPGIHSSHTTSLDGAAPLSPTEDYQSQNAVYTGTGIPYPIFSDEELLAPLYMLHKMKA